MEDRRRNDGDSPLPEDEIEWPEAKNHLGVFAMIVLLAALGLGTLFFLVSVIDYALGFFTGVALYALFWRWRYGFWPD